MDELLTGHSVALRQILDDITVWLKSLDAIRDRCDILYADDPDYAVGRRPSCVYYDGDSQVSLAKIDSDIRATRLRLSKLISQAKSSFTTQDIFASEPSPAVDVNVCPDAKSMMTYLRNKRLDNSANHHPIVDQLLSLDRALMNVHTPVSHAATRLLRAGKCQRESESIRTGLDAASCLCYTLLRNLKRLMGKHNSTGQTSKIVADTAESPTQQSSLRDAHSAQDSFSLSFSQDSSTLKTATRPQPRVPDEIIPEPPTAIV